MRVKYDLENLDADTDYSVHINYFGVLGDDCDKVGDEYNPLHEVNSRGWPNPHQDPARGRLTMITSDENGAYD